MQQKQAQRGQTEKNKEKRMEMYRHGKVLVQKFSRVVDRVLTGETEITACLMEDVDKSWMRRFIQSDISIKQETAAGNGIVEVNCDDWMSWQNQFLVALTGQEYYVPPGFDSIYEECVTEVCSEIECEVLCLHFQEGLTLQETGERLVNSPERVRQKARHYAHCAIRTAAYRSSMGWNTAKGIQRGGTKQGSRNKTRNNNQTAKQLKTADQQAN